MKSAEFARECLRMMLRPLARFCVRHSLPIQELIEAAKGALIEAAEEDMRAAGEKINVSRLSVATGVHRRDIVRLTGAGERESDAPISLISRVVRQWQRGKPFLTAAGKPRLLDDEEFRRLVYLVSRDLNAATVLFQLERLGVAEKTQKGVRLKRSTSMLQDDVRTAFKRMAADIADLNTIVQENLEGAAETPHMYTRIEHTNLLQSSVPVIRRWLIDEGRLFHERLSRFLARHDKGSARSGPGGARIVVTAFGRVTDADD